MQRNQRILCGWFATALLDLTFVIILACFVLTETRWQVILFITLVSVFKIGEFGIVIALNAEIVQGKKRLLYEQIPEAYYGFKPRAAYSLIGMASAHESVHVMRKPGVAILNPAHFTRQTAAIPTSTTSVQELHDYALVVRKPGTTFLNSVHLHSNDELIREQLPLYTVTTVGVRTAGSEVTEVGDPVVK